MRSSMNSDQKPSPPALGSTKTVSQCGRPPIVLTLRKCWKCDEPTYFQPSVFVCNSCAEEYIDLGPERSSLRMSDYVYQGCVPDKTEAMGLPHSDQSYVEWLRKQVSQQLPGSEEKRTQR